MDAGKFEEPFMEQCLSTRVLRRCAALALLVAMAPLVAIGQDAAAPATTVSEIKAGMTVVVAADGSVASVVPDAGLSEPIRAGLIKRVSQWRYKVPMWEGRAVSLEIRQGVRLQFVATTSGGYAVRVVGPAYVKDPDPRFALVPPRYPKRENIRGVTGTFAYAMRVGVDGHLSQIRRIYPEGGLDRYAKALDAAALASIEGEMRRPILVDGVPVSCEVTFPFTFLVDGAKPEKLDLKPLEVGMQKCPVTELETRIEGTLL